MKNFLLSKKTIKFFLILVFICTALPCSAASSANKYMFVSVENAPLKTKASVASKSIAALDYATPVMILKEKGSWVEIELINDSSVSGWLPVTSLTKRKITAAQKDVNTDAHEIALAGKGFNSSVEESYSKNHESHFEEVDLIENNILDENAIFKFLSEGKLNDGE